MAWKWIWFMMPPDPQSINNCFFKKFLYSDDQAWGSKCMHSFLKFIARLFWRKPYFNWLKIFKINSIIEKQTIITVIVWKIYYGPFLCKILLQYISKRLIMNQSYEWLSHRRIITIAAMPRRSFLDAMVVTQLANAWVKNGFGIIL